MDEYEIKEKIKEEERNLQEILSTFTCHTDMGRFGCDTLDTDLAREAIKHSDKISGLLKDFLILEEK